jgi:MFS family permease
MDAVEPTHSRAKLLLALGSSVGIVCLGMIAIGASEKATHLYPANSVPFRVPSRKQGPGLTNSFPLTSATASASSPSLTGTLLRTEPIAGYLIDRFGPRVIVCGSGALVATAPLTLGSGLNDNCLRPTAERHQKLAEFHRWLRADTVGIATPSQVLGSLRRSAVK